MESDPGERSPRRGWIVVTVLATVIGLLNAVGAVVLLATRHWFEAGIGLAVVVAAYWFAAGAWLRTPWGNVDLTSPPPGPPVLSTKRAQTYISMGAVCLVACAIALGLQALDGRW